MRRGLGHEALYRSALCHRQIKADDSPSSQMATVEEKIAKLE
jgi:hypothetical protein